MFDILLNVKLHGFVDRFVNGFGIHFGTRFESKIEGTPAPDQKLRFLRKLAPRLHESSILQGRGTQHPSNIR